MPAQRVARHPAGAAPTAQPGSFQGSQCSPHLHAAAAAAQVGVIALEFGDCRRMDGSRGELSNRLPNQCCQRMRQFQEHRTLLSRGSQPR